MSHPIDMKLEAIVLPVADVDRAAAFYGQLGWRVDADIRTEGGGRILQFTPPGSPCSILIGTGLTPSAPGSTQFVHLIVSDIEVARAELSSMSSMQVTQVAAADTASTPAKGASVAAADVTAAADAIDTGGPAEPKQSPNAAALVADGPTKDCIPLGTRFMGQGGDSFPLCKTKMVLKVAAVSDGIATITGAGDVAAGASVPYSKGCMLAVFTADTSGYAEMRVTCQ